MKHLSKQFDCRVLCKRAIHPINICGNQQEIESKVPTVIYLSPTVVAKLNEQTQRLIENIDYLTESNFNLEKQIILEKVGRLLIDIYDEEIFVRKGLASILINIHLLLDRDLILQEARRHKSIRKYLS